MPSISGTKVISKVVPLDTLDTYATHDDQYGAGGLRTDVADAATRNAITTPRRKKGMIVYQTDNQHYYKLNNDLTTWTDFGTTLGGGGASAVWITDKFDLSTTVSFPHSFVLAQIPITDSETVSHNGIILDKNDGGGIYLDEYNIVGNVITLSADYNVLITGILKIKYQY
jgi:hypothetical protein